MNPTSLLSEKKGTACIVCPTLCVRFALTEQMRNVRRMAGTLSSVWKILLDIFLVDESFAQFWCIKAIVRAIFTGFRTPVTARMKHNDPADHEMELFLLRIFVAITVSSIEIGLGYLVRRLHSKNKSRHCHDALIWLVISFFVWSFAMVLFFFKDGLEVLFFNVAAIHVSMSSIVTFLLLVGWFIYYYFCKLYERPRRSAESEQKCF